MVFIGVAALRGSRQVTRSDADQELIGAHWSGGRGGSMPPTAGDAVGGIRHMD